MGGLFHFFDFNQSSVARKIHKHKKNVDGLEAPRNSLELQVETSKSYSAVGDVAYSYPVEEDWPEKNSYHTEASMKKLISEEILKESNTRQKAPSIVARLMGVDVLPLETKSVIRPIDKKNYHSGIKPLKKERNGRSSVAHVSSYSDSSRQIQLDTFYPCRDREDDRWSSCQDFEKPRPREHPQEEELQKFKKEFEAWQAARFRECSEVVELEGIPMQRLAQEKLNKEKVAIYASSPMTGRDKPGEPMSLASKSTSYERRGSQHHRHKSELFPTEEKESLLMRRRSKSIDFEPTSLINYHEKRDSASTRIVILKPGPDRMCDHEDCWTGALGTLEGRSSIEDFLEEVKERLKYELQGKTLKKGSVVRGSGIETPFSEKPSDPKQIARHIAKHVRESVSRDLGVNLVRSESTRSYRSEIQFNGPGSPEFINKDARRFLSERLRNVLKRESHSDSPVVVSDRTKSSVLDKERIGVTKSGDTSLAGNEWNHWEIEKDGQEMQTRSFRHGDDNGVLNRELSPRNLVRSLSAPVSGTSFGQLLLEDRHILTGAQIRRKHEAVDNFSVDVRRRKKERFNFKEKVSNFRYRFTLRRRLFGKKIQSIESHGVQYDHVKDIMSGPTVIMNLGETHENSTEVPPSPASFCSTPREDFWRPTNYLSPISTPDVTLGEDDAVPQVFRDISSNLNELRRQLNELENRPDDTSVEQDPTESEILDLEDQAKAYIQDLLVASGFYDGSSYKSLSRQDPLSQPISNAVFEKVEESYRKLAEENDSTIKDHIEKKAEHKMLLDMLNEALSTLVGPPVTMSSFRRKIINSSTLSPPHGRKLLDSVWEIISVYLYPPADISYYALDIMVAQDLGSTPWSCLMDEEINSLGREVECLIIGELVEEILNQIR